MEEIVDFFRRIGVVASGLKMAVDLEVLSRFVGHLGAPEAAVFGGAVRTANRTR